MSEILKTELLQVKDGDILVVTIPANTHPTEARAIGEKIEEPIKSVGCNVRVIILDERIAIGVIRRDAEVSQ